MSQAFGEYSRPTDTISAILGTYPFSVGLFRELLQNSDDARASKQVFVLDSRSHPKEKLFDSKLSGTQGPALLAFNDALFTDADWEALQSIHRSSKTSDTTKIGKYGIGFRSCYHVTDNPEILSSSFLAILDPHHDFTTSGGTKFNFVEQGSKYADQLACFDFFLHDITKPFQGSVVRLPLRTPAAKSSLSNKVVHDEEIHTLFMDLIREELDISLLFLKNVKAIEIHQISKDGSRTCLATSTIERGDPTSWDVYSASRMSVSTLVGSKKEKKEWRIFQSSYKQKDAADLLSYRLGRKVHEVLDKHKLYPQLGIAVPLSSLSSATSHKISGRLFTYLPLPIMTGFEACHVHGLFALTSSRQNLRSNTEVGIVRGSDDSVLVEWNTGQFDTYLPQTWAALIPVLIQQDGLKDPYRVWPPDQPLVQTGDSVYWRALPEKVLASIVKSNGRVWPLLPQGSGSQVEFTELGGAFVAPSSASEIDAITLIALVKVGMKIIRPPQYIFELLKANFGYAFRMLTPDAAYRDLLDHRTSLHLLRPGERLAILRYLLSTEDLRHVIDLPIVPLAEEDHFVALTARKNGTTMYTLLDKVEHDSFGAFDKMKTINLLSITPPSLADLFRRTGPEVLNVEHLTSVRIGRYLRASSNPFGLDFTKPIQPVPVSEAAAEWLAKFWMFFSVTWPEESRDELYGAISDLHLLPARNGLLERVDDGVFVEEDYARDQGLYGVLQSLGITLLHPRFSSSTAQAMRNARHQLLKSPTNDVLLVLDRLRTPGAGDGFRLDKEKALVLLGYLARWIPYACQEIPLSVERRRKLRSLPIFPVLLPSLPDVKKPSKTSRFLSFGGSKPSKVIIPQSITSIAEGTIVYGISGTSSLLSLPFIEKAAFLDGSAVDLAILTHLSETPCIGEPPLPLSDVDVLALAVDHFSAQPRELQSALLDYMVDHRDSLPPKILNGLRQVKFITAMDGSLQAPQYVVDPKSSLTALFLGSSDRIARLDDEAFAKKLRSMSLLRDKLTSEVILERIDFVSTEKISNPKAADTVANRLLELIYLTGFDCSSIEFPIDAKWLPTERGFFGHEECLDCGLYRRELFDEVLPSLDEGVRISPSLRAAFGWDKPLPLSTLNQQLSAVISKRDERTAEGTYIRCRTLIKEFAQRKLSDEDISVLQGIVSDYPWIPVTKARLARTSRAVFRLPVPLAGFYEISASFAERAEICHFLLRMGCTERPSTAILTSELRSLRGSSSVEQAVLILKSLPRELSDKDRAELVIPDIQGAFHPIDDIYYNDVGDRALFEAGDVNLAHPWVDDATARQLRINRLGLKSVLLNNPGIDMGEKLTTTIRNVLKQYTEQQTLTEFLANASDAGASNFKILIDDHQAPAAKLLSPLMAPFQTCASLVIYNDGIFTQQDFDGICRTGVGGKEGRTNTIGQFGLGSLSMFHFTEMATILSGDKMLFLDPSKTHLPIADWASLLVPLSQMQRLYSDHLAAFDGLFGYMASQTTFYPGTIFRLPLRTHEHISGSPILNTVRTSSYVRENIVRPYWQHAQQSLLFTKIEKISTFYRDTAGRTIQGWSLSANREAAATKNLPVSGEDNFSYNSYTLKMSLLASPSSNFIHDEWHIVLSAIPIARLPKEFSSLIEPHRLRSPITVGVAARASMSKERTRKYHAHNLFSTLPLPMVTTLPVHMTASFILTPDRRHIRFDDYDNLESQYNRWLLATVGPPLYLNLLESLLHLYGHNDIWWPGNSTQQDNVTRVLVDSFYSMHLMKTRRLVCSTPFQQDVFFPPSEAILIGEEAREVARIISLVPQPRFVKFPTIIRERAIQSSAILSLTPLLLSRIVRQHAETLIHLYGSSRLTLEEVQFLLDAFVEDSEIDIIGLPLVPLSNGTLVKVEARGMAKFPYFVWKQSASQVPEKRLFKPHRILHEEFNAEQLLYLDLNVVMLTEAPANVIEIFLKEHLPNDDFLEYPTKEQREWISMFWKEYPAFKTQFDVQSFPLVRTTHGSYVSLDRAKNHEAVFVTSSATEPEWLCTSFDKMGISVVQRDVDVPPPLKEMFTSIPTFMFQDVLKYFQYSIRPISSAFLGLDKDSFIRFAEWCRDQLKIMPSADLHPAAMRLPIWPLLGSGELILKSGRDVQMLPYAMEGDLLMLPRFWPTPLVRYWSQLRDLGVTALTTDQVWTGLRLPANLGEEERAPYKRLLNAMLNDRTFTPITLLVPNGSWKLVPVNTLYARHPLFLSSFGDSPDTFISESYVDMESRLAQFGLKGPSNLDFDTFAVCARAIDRVSEGTSQASADRLQRARVVFRAYAEDLPLRIEGTNDDEKWKMLGSLRFIPRDPMRQSAMRIPEGSPYVKPLPELVAPNEVLLEAYESVAWTQRAKFLEPPHNRILVSNRNLGQPTASEVVEHLCVLALQVAQDHPGNRYLLSDLKATYQWLDDHQDEAEDFIIQYSDKPLFLNVDDPEKEDWKWHCADEMFFNESGDDDQMKPVHEFLRPFRDLLVVAGVEEIVKPIVPITAPSDVEAKMSALYSGFDLMRKEGRFTDVVFITDDEEPVRFPAHRAILGPMSDYLNDLFCGDFAESRPASSEDPVEIELEYSAACVSVVMEYLYTGTTGPDLENLTLDGALEVLELSQYWALKDLNEIVQASIISRNLIRPETYEEILERATVLDAKLVKVACEFYERENRDVILRLKGEFTGPRKPKRLPKKATTKFLSPIENVAGSDEREKPRRMRKLMHRLTGSFSRSASKLNLRASFHAGSSSGAGTSSSRNLVLWGNHGAS